MGDHVHIRYLLCEGRAGDDCVVGTIINPSMTKPEKWFESYVKYCFMTFYDILCPWLTLILWVYLMSIYEHDGMGSI